jgi:hypothetical protein
MKHTTAWLVLALVCLAWGHAAEPQFQPGVQIQAAGKPIAWDVGHLVPCVSDWNGDGKKDLLVGRFMGGEVRLYINQGTDEAPVFGESIPLEAGGKPIKLDAG